MCRKLFVPGLCLIAFFPGPAPAQRFSIGGVAGTNLTEDFPVSRSSYFDPDHPGGDTIFDLYSSGHRPILGFAAGFALPWQLSIEADALHRNLRDSHRFLFPDGSRREGRTDLAGTWEFPVLLKYTLPGPGRLRPFVEAGPSFRTWKNPIGADPSHFGVTAGAGVAFSASRFRISPALRYTRWQYDGDYPHIATKADQIELVTTVSYATAPDSWMFRGRRFRLGVIGGTAFTGGFSRSLVNQGYRPIHELQGYAAGLAVEAEINNRWSVEFDGIYRPLRDNGVDTYVFNGMPFVAHDEFTVVTWQLPALLKYKTRVVRRVQPVFEVGPSFRVSGNLNGYEPSKFGITAGGGISKRLGSSTISPVVRYTRWAEDSNRGARTAPNQVEALVSFVF